MKDERSTEPSETLFNRLSSSTRALSLSPSPYSPDGTTRKSSPYTCVLWSDTLVSANSKLAKFISALPAPSQPSFPFTTHALASNSGPACQVAGCSLMKVPGGMRKAVMSEGAGKR